MLNPANQKFAGFFIGIKTPFYAPNRNKNERNSVRTLWNDTTHRIIHNYLIVNMFSE